MVNKIKFKIQLPHLALPSAPILPLFLFLALTLWGVEKKARVALPCPLLTS